MNSKIPRLFFRTVGEFFCQPFIKLRVFDVSAFISHFAAIAVLPAFYDKPNKREKNVFFLIPAIFLITSPFE